MKLSDMQINGTAANYEGRWTVYLQASSCHKSIANASGLGLTWKVAMTRATERLIEELELLESSSD